MKRLLLILTWVLVLKLSQIVDIVVDNDVEIGAFVMRRDIVFGEGLRHDFDSLWRIWSS